MSDLIDCSIIIPCYNSANVIMRAIDSIELQNLEKNIEVIIVDDGSTDNVEIVIKGCIRNSSKIKYIRKENGGVSSARNLGLRCACGKYVFFMDADDELKSNVLLSMIEYAEMQKADLVVADHVEYYTKTGRSNEKSAGIPYNILLDNSYVEKNIFYRYFIGDNVGLANLWNKLFSLNLIRRYGVKFDEARTHGEDWAFCIEYFMHVKKMYAINSVVYKYNLDGTQLYNKYKTNLGKGFVKGYIAKKEINNKYNICSKYSREYRLFQEGFYYQILDYLKADISPQEKKEFLSNSEVKECLKYLTFLKNKQLNDVGFSRRDRVAFLLLYIGLFNTVIKKIYK